MWFKPVFSTHRDDYQEIRPRQSKSWKHHDVQIRGLCRQMPWLTMEDSHYWQRWIHHIALYVHLLYVLRFIDGCLQQYGYTYILVHAASYSCCIQSYRRFINAHPGSNFSGLHWQRSCGLTGECIEGACRWVTYLMTRQLISLIWIHSNLAEVVVYPWFAGVEYERKMIRKRSGKSWGKYC